MQYMSSKFKILDSSLSVYGCASHLLNLLGKDITSSRIISHVTEINKYFRKQNGHRQADIRNSLGTREYTGSFLSRTIYRYSKHRTLKDAPRSGRPRTIGTPAVRRMSGRCFRGNRPIGRSLPEPLFPILLRNVSFLKILEGDLSNEPKRKLSINLQSRRG